jgi:hypothetical protein
VLRSVSALNRSRAKLPARDAGDETGPAMAALCFVGTFRSDELATSSFLQQLAALRASSLAALPVAELALAELSPDEALALTRALLAQRDLDPALAEAIAVESQGSPFYLQELARSQDREGGLRERLQRRIRRLPEPAQRLLEIIAVATAPMPEEVAALAVGASDRGREMLARLRGEQLVRVRDVDGKRVVDLYHDCVRKAALGPLQPSQGRQLHARLAQR